MSSGKSWYVCKQKKKENKESSEIQSFKFKKKFSIPQKQKIRLKKDFEGEMPRKTFQQSKFPMGRNQNEASGTSF